MQLEHRWRRHETANAPHLTGNDGRELARNLFSPIYRNEVNSEEQDTAMCLDGQAGANGGPLAVKCATGTSEADMRKTGKATRQHPPTKP